MKNRMRYGLMACTALGASIFISMGNVQAHEGDALEQICHRYCPSNAEIDAHQDADADKSIFIINRNMVLGDGSTVNRPSAKIYLKSADGYLVSPEDTMVLSSNASNGVKPNNTVVLKSLSQNMAAGSGYPGKSIGLNPKCFSTIDYKNRPGGGQKFGLEELENFNFSANEVTITFINFTKDGRLESRSLEDMISAMKNSPAQTRTAMQQPLKMKGAIQQAQPTNATAASISASTSASTSYSPIQAHSILKQIYDEPLIVNGDERSKYQRVQDVLMHMTRPTPDQFRTNDPRERNLSEVPPEKTPFFKELDGATSPTHGEHVFFYVLIDEHLRFNRLSPALITYSPVVKAQVGTLFDPYTEYPVVPIKRKVKDKRLDVLTFHFKLGGDMVYGQDQEIECRYPYDLGVIAKGQNGFVHETPLLIDPEVKTKGIGR